MPQIGPAEIVVIVLVGLLVFGPSRLPEIGRQVGRGMREVKKFQGVLKDEMDSVLHSQDSGSVVEDVHSPASPTSTPR